MITQKAAHDSFGELHLLASRINILAEIAYQIMEERDDEKKTSLALGLAGFLEDVRRDVEEVANILEDAHI